MSIHRKICLRHWSNTKAEQIENEEKRLRTLSDFQVKMVLHAFKCKLSLCISLFVQQSLTAFNAVPKVKRVAYSTCSIHTEENEEVVKRILAETKQFKLIDMFAQTMDRGIAISSDEEDQGKSQVYGRLRSKKKLTDKRS